MRITIIKDNGTVIIDGVGFRGIDMSSQPPSFHALQWYGDSGEIEYVDPDTGNHSNQKTTDLSPFQPQIDGWNEKKYEYENPPLEPPAVPESITRRQCALQLLASGLITTDEAVAMTKDGTPPQAILAYINEMPAESRPYALIDFAATSYYRNNPLISQILLANGATEQQGDEFFIAASQL